MLTWRCFAPVTNLMQQIASLHCALEMTALTISLPNIRKSGISRCHGHTTASWKIPRSLVTSNFPRGKNLPELCAKLHYWKTIAAYAPADEDANPSNIMESIIAEGASKLPMLEREVEAIEKKEQQSVLQQSLKWPMWLLGPSFLLVTGMTPTLWLPLSSVFLGPNTAGILSLLGLDCIFNMGATLFLLMADACARPSSSTATSSSSQIPLAYKFWNIIANVVGFVVPIGLYLFSCKGLLEPHLQFIPFAVLLVPYLLLLSVQIVTEILTWHWNSPVWLMAPVVYEAYRILQLMRGIKLGMEISAPGWVVMTLRGLVSWWVLILGIQLMRVAWFAGYTSRSQEQI